MINKKRKKKLVQGIGINDANYVVETRNYGVKWTCPYYLTWSAMMRRVNGISTENSPMFGYEDVRLHDSWVLFSSFKKWMETKQWQGMELDKDLLYPGNKLYGPNTCVFIPKDLNKAIVKKKRNKSMYKQGVQRNGFSYTSALNTPGKRIHLGSFDTEMEAHVVYSEQKSKYLENFYGINEDIDEALGRYLKVFNNYIERKRNECN